MTILLGHDAAGAAFRAAADGGTLHHAWLLAGPQGVGKAGFARTAARDLLVAAAGDGAAVGAGALFDAGTHPDFRMLVRLPKDPEKPGADLARSITIAQVRSLGAMFATTPSLGPRRVIVIDAIDDLERGAANALLKNLEEPPTGTVFLLVSHAPGRLLPTIRSRTRLLRFAALGDAEMTRALAAALPDARRDDIAALVRAGEGAPGRALGYAGLDIAAIDAAVDAIAHDGDPLNARRLTLAAALAGKAAQPRYEAFLDRVPAFVAAAARARRGPALRVALDMHAAARDLAGAARALSLDPQATVIEMAGIVARLAG